MKYFYPIAAAACLLGHFHETLTGAEVSVVRPETVFVDDDETPIEIATLLNTNPAGDSIRLVDTGSARRSLWHVAGTNRGWYPRFVCSWSTPKTMLPRLDVPQQRVSSSKVIDLNR
jgi:hypothetical protein